MRGDWGGRAGGVASALSCARLAAEMWRRTGISGDVAVKGWGVWSRAAGGDNMYAGWSGMLKGIEVVMLRCSSMHPNSNAQTVVWILQEQRQEMLIKGHLSLSARPVEYVFSNLPLSDVVSNMKVDSFDLIRLDRWHVRDEAPRSCHGASLQTEQ